MDKKSDKAEAFWREHRIKVAESMGSNGHSLEIKERLEASRLMASEHMRTVRNLARIAEATKELQKLLDDAAVLANEIAELNTQNKLVPLTAGPIREDPDEWKGKISRLYDGVSCAVGHLEKFAPDIVEQLGAIDTTPEKSEKKTKK